MIEKERSFYPPVPKTGEKCAVFGIYSTSSNNSNITAKGLFSLQHRGQESSGITSSDGSDIFFHRRTGLVSQVYDEESLNSLIGNLAIGHNRYATYSKRSAGEHLQPVIDTENSFTLAHNGNIPDTGEIESFLDKHGIKTESLNDTEMMHAAILYYVKKGASLDDAIIDAVPLFTGAFSLLAMDRRRIVAIRDKNGIRPFSIGSLDGGYVFSSETCAFNTVGARFIRDVAPGEMVVANENGLQSVEFAKGEQKLDIFEFIYFSRPDSVLLEKLVYTVRENFGKILAEEYPIKGDIVIPVPDSGVPAAIGYSEASGIPFKEGLIKNRYIGRTFITPGQDKRNEDVTLKLNPMPDVLRGMRVIVADDSIVRGTTSKRLVKMIRDAGAREVHMVITSPLVRFPDFYGIDTPSQKELIGANKTVEEIRRFISADSLSFLSLEGTISATGLPAEVFSTSCFTGEYPIDIGKRKKEISQ
ncbi:MAG: amidophosphoribosyltransferase [Candidatus Levybacteria bacterium CG10_big_fil_rev_8_21_14_0_10_35_13]|nr:MAG: amidophosphoribosyltransferase [Candidatus Levybacteria bacterium CG10_big_fil_rev_8_21_14_0_10_35_13]